MKKLYFTLVLLLYSTFFYAQPERVPQKIDFDVSLKNMHYWRGYAVTTAPMFAGSLYYQSPDKHWRMGFWGGMGFTGEYREFDSFISYNNGGFTIALWDIYNFSTPEISGRNFFDYDNRTTGHFIDLTLAYGFGESFPLSLSLSTILYGRDSDFSGADVNAPFERTGKLRYTSYAEARYTLIRKENYQLQAFIGGAFAWKEATNNFYTSRRGINFVGFTYYQKLAMGSYTIPVQATPAWNPSAGHAYFEIALTFF